MWYIHDIFDWICNYILQQSILYIRQYKSTSPGGLLYMKIDNRNDRFVFHPIIYINFFLSSSLIKCATFCLMTSNNLWPLRSISTFKDKWKPYLWRYLKEKILRFGLRSYGRIVGLVYFVLSHRKACKMFNSLTAY